MPGIGLRVRPLAPPKSHAEVPDAFQRGLTATSRWPRETLARKGRDASRVELCCPKCAPCPRAAATRQVNTSEAKSEAAEGVRWSGLPPAFTPQPGFSRCPAIATTARQ